MINGPMLQNPGAAPSDEERIVASLESPKPHRLVFGAPNRFSGVVFDVEDRRVEKLHAIVDGAEAGEFPANLPSPDIGSHLPQLKTAASCRFDFELVIPEAADTLVLQIVYATTSHPSETRKGWAILFTYDLASLRRSASEIDALRRRLESLPTPPEEIVSLTQGHTDVRGYQDSILPGLLTARKYLSHSGVNLDRVQTLLDFGCGSGRLLAGWWLEEKPRDLFGCDTNGRLIAWARENLPAAIRFTHTGVEPPLPYPDGQFDLVTAISVFTHLKFSTQKKWVGEFRRILKRGGVLLATLHGPIYARLFLKDRLEEFRKAGCLEIEAREGSNEFASYHDPGIVPRLFEGFEVLRRFPSGAVDGQRELFPLASVQDVWVFYLSS
jgi:SAM-dependent methyltransferase